MKRMTMIAVAAFALTVVPLAASAQHGGGHGSAGGHGGAVSHGGTVAHGGAGSARGHGSTTVTHGVSGGHAVARTTPLVHGAASGLGLHFGSTYTYGPPHYGSVYSNGHPYYGSAYGYGHSYPYAVPYRYFGSGYGYAYGPVGGLRIQGLPPDAEVFGDGYFVGVVDQFDGPLQRLPLEPGPHHIEIRVAGAPPIQFDINVQPGRTVIYRPGLPYRP